MRFRSALLVVVVLSGLLAAGVATPAGASTPATPLCPVCGHTFEYAAEDEGVTVSTVDSEVEIALAENGSAHWTARTRVEGGTSERLNGSRLDRAVETAFDHWRLDLDPENVSAERSGRTVVVTFETPGFAERRHGVLVVDTLYRPDWGASAHANAEPFVLRGPDGSTVTASPGDATVDGRTLTWHDDYLPGSTLVAFGAGNGLGAHVATWLALADLALPTVLGNLGRFVLLPAFGFGLAVLVLTRIVQHAGLDERISPVAAIGGSLVLAGGLPVGASALGSLTQIGIALAGLYAVPLVAVVRWRRAERTPQPAVFAATSLLAVLVGTTVGAVLTDGWILGLYPRELSFPLLLLAVGSLFPIGRLAAERHRQEFGVVAATAVYGLFVASMVDLVGFNHGLMFAYLVTITPAVAAAGTPLYVAGAALAKRAE